MLVFSATQSNSLLQESKSQKTPMQLDSDESGEGSHYFRELAGVRQ
jgi:hypothetical protein